MNIAPKSSFVLSRRHLLGIEGLCREDISGLLDLGEEFVDLNRQVEKKRTSLRGNTQINLFFESSIRIQSSFDSRRSSVALFRHYLQSSDFKLSNVSLR